METKRKFQIWIKNSKQIQSFKYKLKLQKKNYKIKLRKLQIKIKLPKTKLKFQMNGCMEGDFNNKMKVTKITNFDFCLKIGMRNYVSTSTYNIHF